jgi:hypothetical protein
MPELIRTNFTYDPTKNGYNTTTTWKTIVAGAGPTTVSGRLVLDGGTVAHYGDILKGEVTFDVNVPVAPAATVEHVFGLAQSTIMAGVYFSIGTTLNCIVSDGTTTTTSADIDWSPDWTNVPVTFKIIWESGLVKFYIGGTKVMTMAGDEIPSIPLSIYLHDDSDTAMSVGNISVSANSYFYQPIT